MGRTLLGIYLNDHVAVVTAGVELARRFARSEAGWAGNGKLDRLAEEMAEDLDALTGMMRAIGEPAGPGGRWAGWLLEKAGRLKLNGRMLSRSPLSRVVELEGLRLGVEGKVAAWRTLRARAAVDARLDADRLDELIANGRSQATRLERLRARAVGELFGEEAAGTA
ncbi:hypothetical protein GCM10027445_60340 [Amycolatopsis endophytica]|uniref:Uncharacterized protein n=1 Tax=Amycolatopsis endophytica TaxID=860233 RepID=A0A853AZW4_9PSEU|nr:hypothetical protein [Amycolatopsis endophytica]NYI88165.1 hypothetical protein [Amycolatopsis endophytica]